MKINFSIENFICIADNKLFGGEGIAATNDESYDVDFGFDQRTNLVECCYEPPHKFLTLKKSTITQKGVLAA